MSVAIVWLRHDLRLHDNPALHDAVINHEAVFPAYLWTPAEESPWAPGAASRWWLHHSLVTLREELERRGSKLVLREGVRAAEILVTLCRETNASTVYAQRCYGAIHAQQETAARSSLLKIGVDLKLTESQTLLPIAASAKADGTAFRVFTPFWRNFTKTYSPTPPLAAPRRIGTAEKVSSLTVEQFSLLPKHRWHENLAKTWQPGERAALNALDTFATGHISDYATRRETPAVCGTSRLSPHLCFGEISPRQVAWRLAQEVGSNSLSTQAHETYFRQLVWREFAYAVLHHFPTTTDEPFNPRFSNFPWRTTHDDWLERWQQGQTGFPIVDAGMRELWQTGWMHNRVRMIVASFLTKHCGISWRSGAQWFWDTLVDADLANNTMGWQWSAGCGVDAAPFFRIFNPLRQSEKFDPQGKYIHAWVPELAQTPPRLLHKASHHDGSHSYPKPILNLDFQREIALNLYRNVRHGSAI